MRVKEALELRIFSSEVEAPIEAPGKEEKPMVKKKAPIEAPGKEE